MADTNGFRIRGLNQDSNRVSIQSNVQDTWMLTRRKFAGLINKWYDVAMTRDEIIVIKCQDGASFAEIEIEPLGDRAGVMIAQSSRRSTKSLRVNEVYQFTLEPGEALVLRSQNIVYPTGPGAGLNV